MKRWVRATEWMDIANCWDSAVHTGENLTDEELDQASQVCAACLVRPECVEWALRENACAVIVAGVYLPDPGQKKDLKKAYNYLYQVLPDEKASRGEEF